MFNVYNLLKIILISILLVLVTKLFIRIYVFISHLIIKYNLYLYFLSCTIFSSAFMASILGSLYLFVT